MYFIYTNQRYYRGAKLSQDAAKLYDQIKDKKYIYLISLIKNFTIRFLKISAKFLEELIILGAETADYKLTLNVRLIIYTY